MSLKSVSPYSSQKTHTLVSKRSSTTGLSTSRSEYTTQESAWSGQASAIAESRSTNNLSACRLGGAEADVQTGPQVEQGTASPSSKIQLDKAFSTEDLDEAFSTEDLSELTEGSSEDSERSCLEGKRSRGRIECEGTDFDERYHSTMKAESRNETTKAVQIQQRSDDISVLRQSLAEKSVEQKKKVQETYPEKVVMEVARGLSSAMKKELKKPQPECEGPLALHRSEVQKVEEEKLPVPLAILQPVNLISPLSAHKAADVQQKQYSATPLAISQRQDMISKHASRPLLGRIQKMPLGFSDEPVTIAELQEVEHVEFPEEEVSEVQAVEQEDEAPEAISEEKKQQEQGFVVVARAGVTSFSPTSILTGAEASVVVADPIQERRGVRRTMERKLEEGALKDSLQPGIKAIAVGETPEAGGEQKTVQISGRKETKGDAGQYKELQEESDGRKDGGRKPMGQVHALALASSPQQKSATETSSVPWYNIGAKAETITGKMPLGFEAMEKEEDRMRIEPEKESEIKQIPTPLHSSRSEAYLCYGVPAELQRCISDSSLVIHSLTGEKIDLKASAFLSLDEDLRGKESGGEVIVARSSSSVLLIDGEEFEAMATASVKVTRKQSTVSLEAHKLFKVEYDESEVEMGILKENERVKGTQVREQELESAFRLEYTMFADTGNFWQPAKKFLKMKQEAGHNVGVQVWEPNTQKEPCGVVRTSGIIRKM